MADAATAAPAATRRSVGISVPAWAPAVLGAVALGGAAVAAGEPVVGSAYLAGWGAFLAMLGAIDARTYRLPNRLVYPALAVAAIHAATGGVGTFTSAVAGGTIVGAPFLVAFLLPARNRRAGPAARRSRMSRAGVTRLAGIAGAVALLGIAGLQHGAGPAVAAAMVATAAFMPALSTLSLPPVTAHGMGGGDVKLAVLAGMFAGASLALAVLTAVLMAGLAAATVLVTGARTWRTTALPYGPFLAGGAVLGLLA